MAAPRPKSLTQLLFSYELSFLVLIVVTAALGGIWVAFWQQTSRESIRINSLLYEAQKLRGDLYRQIREVYDASRAQDARALDVYWAHIYDIDRRFYALEAQATDDKESAAVEEMRRAQNMLQTQLNQLLSDTGFGARRPDQVIQPAYEYWLRGGFETALDKLRVLVDDRSQSLDERLGRLNTISLWVFPVPLLVALGLLLSSRRRLRSEFSRPMENLRQGALQISQGNLAHRVTEQGTRETVSLAQTVNAMAADLAATRDALVEREKQAALGTLVPVVAHNIRNPLASIRATTQLIEQEDERQEFATAKRTIIETVDRLERWVSALLTYLNPLQPQCRPVAVHELIDNSLQPLQSKLAERRIAVARDDKHLRNARTTIDLDLMEQAVHGLLLNAIEASPNDSTIEIHIEEHPDGYQVLIDDQGPGMSFVPAPRDLEPGPSTKTTGTGLGIPFALKVCSAHGIPLQFLDRPQGGGTRVRLFLARAEAE